MTRRKPKLPRLVVDNNLSEPDEFTYAEFKAVAVVKSMIALHQRYPEIERMYKRALANRDYVMTNALFDLTLEYYEHVDALTEARAQKRRRKLKVLKKKPGE